MDFFVLGIYKHQFRARAKTLLILNSGQKKGLRNVSIRLEFLFATVSFPPLKTSKWKKTSLRPSSKEIYKFLHIINKRKRTRVCPSALKSPFVLLSVIQTSAQFLIQFTFSFWPRIKEASANRKKAFNIIICMCAKLHVGCWSDNFSLRYALGDHFLDR